MTDPLKQAADLVYRLAETQGDRPVYIDGEDTSVVEGSWAIQNNQSCEWALKRAANLRLEKQEIEDAVAAAKARLDARAAVLTERLDRGINFFEGHIAEYATLNKEPLLGGGKKKSRTFLYGTVGWRKSPEGLTVTNPELLETWLLAHGDKALYRTKVSPDMNALKRRLAETGAIPPGTEVKPETEKLYIDPVDPAGPIRKGTP